MKLPFVSRFMHEQVTRMLEVRIAELDQERKLLFDRLAQVGLGGPLFSPMPATVATPPPSVKAAEDPEPERTEEQMEHIRLLSLRNRPSDMAAALTQIARKRWRKQMHQDARGSHIARVQLKPEEIDEHIDRAIERGKALAS